MQSLKGITAEKTNKSVAGSAALTVYEREWFSTRVHRETQHTKKLTKGVWTHHGVQAGASHEHSRADVNKTKHVRLKYLHSMFGADRLVVARLPLRLRVIGALDQLHVLAGSWERLSAGHCKTWGVTPVGNILEVFSRNKTYDITWTDTNWFFSLFAVRGKGDDDETLNSKFASRRARCSMLV